MPKQQFRQTHPQRISHWPSSVFPRKTPWSFPMARKRRSSVATTTSRLSVPSTPTPCDPSKRPARCLKSMLRRLCERHATVNGAAASWRTAMPHRVTPRIQCRLSARAGRFVSRSTVVVRPMLFAAAAWPPSVRQDQCRVLLRPFGGIFRLRNRMREKCRKYFRLGF